MPQIPSFRPRVAPERTRVGKPLRKGKLVYHGTSGVFDPETLGEGFSGAWVSDSLEVAEWFAGWRTAEHTEPQYIHTYRVIQSPTLWVAKTPGQFAWLNEHYQAFDTEELTEAICRDGKDGWYLPDNYPTGADIFLCDPMQVLEYVETTELEPSAPRENPAWRPGVVRGSDWSVRLPDGELVYNYRDKLPHGPPFASVIFRYPIPADPEVGAFERTLGYGQAFPGGISVLAPPGARPETRYFPLSSSGMHAAVQWLATFGIPPPPWKKVDLRLNGRVNARRGLDGSYFRQGLTPPKPKRIGLRVAEDVLEKARYMAGEVISLAYALERSIDDLSVVEVEHRVDAIAELADQVIAMADDVHAAVLWSRNRRGESLSKGDELCNAAAEQAVLVEERVVEATRLVDYLRRGEQ